MPKSEESSMTTYVHYGSDHFEPSAFIPVRNAGWMEGGFRPKPADGTGLWASRENDEWGWEAWCRESNFNIGRLRHSFRFTLPDADILTINSPDQLIDLPKLHRWEPKKLLWIETIKPGEIPTMEQLHELYMPNWCYLDFEKLAEKYDAIELRNSLSFRDSLPAWDCDCILLMKADKVVEI